MLGLKRALAVIALSSALTWLGSSAALAAGNPDRQQLPPSPDAVGTFCGAGPGVVVVHAELDQEYIKAFNQQDGTIRLAIEGRLVITVTGNGRTLTFNASGPATLIVSADGSQLLAYVSEGQSFVIEPFGLFLYSGKVNYDPATFLVASSTGHVTDVCALLS